MLKFVLRISRVRKFAPLSRAVKITRVASTGWQSRSYINVHSYHTISSGSCTKRCIHLSSTLGDEVVVVKTPSFAESISEGDVRWDKGVGDTVLVDEVVAEIETDKTSIPVPSSVSGVIEELLVADGDTVTAGTDLCRIRVTDKVDVPPAPAKDPPPSVGATPVDESIREGEKQVAEQQEAPPSVVSGPPPSTIPPIPAVPTQPLSHGPPTPAPVTGTPSSTISSREERRVKMNRMRQRIAERLKEAQNTNAMLTTFNEIDMSRVVDMRSRHKDAFLKKHGVKLGFMSPFVKAACFALQDQPVVNAVIDGNEIIYRDYIDISCAVATPKGLVVPILRDVQKMSFADIEKELNALAAKAREGTLAIEDMDGGTFTISNGGVYGSMFGTPIINPPQSAILGMHATMDRPMAINGKVEIRPMMYVALTYDHRLIDGREAVTFLKKIKSAVEDPTVLLTDI